MQVGAHYADKRHQESEKCIQGGILSYLEKRKDNKSSPHYEKEPYQVMVGQIQLKSPEGMEYK